MSDEHRRLRQQLESLSLAGLRFPPRRNPLVGVRLPVAAEVRAPDPAPLLQPTKASMAQSKVVASEKTLFKRPVAGERAANQGRPTSGSVPPPRSPGLAGVL